MVSYISFLLKKIKNKKILFALLLLFFFALFLFIRTQYYVESFIGTGTHDQDDEKRKTTKPTSKYDLINDLFSKYKDQSQDQDQEKDSDEKEIKISEQEKVGENKALKENQPKELPYFELHPNRCPEGMKSASVLTGSNLTCGKDGKAARAVATIRNGHLAKITVVDGGNGYDEKDPPYVKIHGGRGHGASAKCVVDKDGKVVAVDILDYGYNYIETPEVEIQLPQREIDSCHICVKD